MMNNTPVRPVSYPVSQPPTSIPYARQQHHPRAHPPQYGQYQHQYHHPQPVTPRPAPGGLPYPGSGPSAAPFVSHSYVAAPVHPASAPGPAQGRTFYGGAGSAPMTSTPVASTTGVPSGRGRKSAAALAAAAQAHAAAHGGMVGPPGVGLGGGGVAPEPAAVSKARAPPDGVEVMYLEAGPSNRFTLSLRSGIPTQVDWALSRLSQYTFQRVDQVLLQDFGGLTDSLMEWPRIWVNAVTGVADVDGTSAAAAADQHLDLDAGKEAEAEKKKRPDAGGGERDRKRLRLDSVTVEDPVARSSHGGCASSRSAVDALPLPPSGRLPAADSATVARRALESALVLRNASLEPRNARFLASSSTRGFHSLVKDVLSIVEVERGEAIRTGVGAVGRTTPQALKERVFGPDEGRRPGQGGASSDTDRVEAASVGKNLDEALLRAIPEMRLYFLEILEAIGSKLSLVSRAPALAHPAPVPAPAPAPATAVRQDKAALTDKEKEKEKGSADRGALAGAAPTTTVKVADPLLARLIEYATSSDRAASLAAVRSLAALAANERNESVLIEAESGAGGVVVSGAEEEKRLEGGSRTISALLRHLLILLPLLPYDQELLFAGLELLYQLVSIPANALRLLSHPAFRTLVRPSVRMLVKALWQEVQSRSWELPFAGGPSSVGQGRAGEGQHGQAGQQEPEEKRIQLTEEEMAKLGEMQEPERALEWMRAVFVSSADDAITQLTFWNAYRTTFALNSVRAPLLAAADLIKNVTRVFSGAMAMVEQQPPQAGAPPGMKPTQRFVIKGIKVRDQRDPYRTFKCRWRGSCASRQNTSVGALAKHVREEHVYGDGEEEVGRCGWMHCPYVAPDDKDKDKDKEGSEEERTKRRRRLLDRHFRVHLPPLESEKEEAVDKPANGHGDGRGASTSSASSSSSSSAAAAAAAERDGRPSKSVSGRAKANGASAPASASAGAKDSCGGGGGVPVPPRFVPYVQQWTPIDGSGLPVGPAFAAALILRSLARTLAANIDRAVLLEEPSWEVGVEPAGAGLTKGKAVEGKEEEDGWEREERFGLPVPPGLLEPSPDEGGGEGRGKSGVSSLPASGSNSGSGSGSDPGVQEGLRVALDAFRTLEPEMTEVALENAVLSGYVLEAMGELGLGRGFSSALAVGGRKKGGV